MAVDPIYDLARNFIKVKFDDLDQQAVEVAKIEVLDGLGVALAGSSQPGVQELFEVLKGFGGKEQSTVIAADAKLPVIHAAQVNATMIHALDFDDTLVFAVAHPSSVLIPTCFAVAEYVGKVSGRECLTTIALGADLMARMGAATRYEVNLIRAGWHFTTLYGYFAAAAVAGRLLGLDEDKMVNALGIAYHQASGNLQCVIDGAMTKRMGPGFAAKGGILAALMAEKGITGAKNCIEGEYGMYNQYHRGGYDRDALLQDLGKVFLGAKLTIKPYPCCRILHACIDASLALVNEYDIKPGQVEEIVIICGPGGYDLCIPLEVKRNPRNPIDAQFSGPWVVATAVAKRKVSIGDFTEEAIKDDYILRLSNKIRAELDSSLPGHPRQASRIKISTREGTYVQQVDYAYGEPENPMIFESVVNKFRDCAAYSIKPLPKETTESIIRAVENFGDIEDIAEIIRKIS